jgi:hypothetical protein
MGRGRQKAKDAKIARELKYADHGTDLRALERELTSGGGATRMPARIEPQPDPEPEYYDRWADDED